MPMSQSQPPINPRNSTLSGKNPGSLGTAYSSVDIKIPPSVSRGGLTIARPVSLPNGRIPLREPPCPGRQVGEGVSPTLDACVLYSRAKSNVQGYFTQLLSL